MDVQNHKFSKNNNKNFYPKLQNASISTEHVLIRGENYVKENLIKLKVQEKESDKEWNEDRWIKRKKYDNILSGG